MVISDASNINVEIMLNPSDLVIGLKLTILMPLPNLDLQLRVLAVDHHSITEYVEHQTRVLLVFVFNYHNVKVLSGNQNLKVSS